MTKRLVVLSAGLSNPSSTRQLADRLASASRSALETKGVSVDVQFIELRGHAHDLADHLLTGFTKTELQASLDAVASADGVIAVSPIFNASMSGLFKLFFDALDKDALVDKPVLLGANAGTARHSLAIDYAIRPMFAYFRAAVVGTAVFAAAQDWTANEHALMARIDRAAEELALALQH